MSREANITELNPQVLRVEHPQDTSSSSGGSGFSTFVPGAAARCIQDLLYLSLALAQISNLYGQQVILQTEASTTCAQAVDRVCNSMSKDDFWGGITAAGGALLGGVCDLGAGMLSLPESGEVDKCRAANGNGMTWQTDITECLEKDGAGAIRDLNPDNSENIERMEKTLNKLKGRRKFDEGKLSTTDKEDLKLAKVKSPEDFRIIKKNIDSYVERTSRDLNILNLQAERKWQSRNMIARAVGQFASSGGQAGKGCFDADKTKLSAAQTYAQTALDQTKGSIGELGKHVDESAQESFQVNQILAQIGQVDQLRG
jgi:hypothetical protein